MNENTQIPTKATARGVVNGRMLVKELIDKQEEWDVDYPISGDDMARART